MEKFEGQLDRRDFLKTGAAWTAVSSGLAVPIETQKAQLNDDTLDFIKAARQMGGFDTLGYRLSSPWLGSDGLLNIAYQKAVLQKDLNGNIGLRKILDELSQMGQDDALGSGRFGVYVPLVKPLSDRDYLNMPAEINTEIYNLSKKGADPGVITSPLTNYGSFEIVRCQSMALERSNDDAKIDKILIGQALDSIGIIPPESLLPVLKLDDCWEGKIWQGEASYYSNAGCLGCNRNRIMANGKKFREDALTLAFMRLPLNSRVRVENLLNGRFAEATVTDRGLFELWGRIADLSRGLKDQIGGGDLTQVRITQLLYT